MVVARPPVRRHVAYEYAIVSDRDEITPLMLAIIPSVQTRC